METQFFSHKLSGIENPPSECPQQRSGPPLGHRESRSHAARRTQRGARSEPHAASRTQRGANLEPRTSSRHPNAQNEDINSANDRPVENGTGQLHAHSTIVAITLAHSRSQPGAACFGAVETLGINNARARNARRIVFVFAKLRLDVTRDKSIRIDFYVVHLPFPFSSISSQTRPSESPATRPVPANHKPSLFLLFLSLPTKKS